MWHTTRFQGERFSKFFSIIFGHDNLINFIRVNFDLKKSHNYSMEEIENMLPWERQIHVDMIRAQVRVENERNREMAMANKGR